MYKHQSLSRVTDASFTSLAAMRALEVAIECHATLPAAYQDEPAAKNWAQVLAAVYVFIIKVMIFVLQMTILC